MQTNNRLATRIDDRGEASAIVHLPLRVAVDLNRQKLPVFDIFLVRDVENGPDESGHL